MYNRYNMNFQEENSKDWIKIQKTIFPTGIPESCVWKSISSIISVLNLIGLIDSSNHMFYPTGGGIDIEKASLSVEDGCIEIFTGFTDIVKPEKLLFESFNDPNGIISALKALHWSLLESMR
jgi:hypothetical protein